MIVSTTETVPGREVAEVLGVVTGNIVQARNIGPVCEALSAGRWGCTRRCWPRPAPRQRG